MEERWERGGEEGWERGGEEKCNVGSMSEASTLILTGTDLEVFPSYQL